MATEDKYYRFRDRSLRERKTEFQVSRNRERTMKVLWGLLKDFMAEIVMRNGSKELFFTIYSYAVILKIP